MLAVLLGIISPASNAANGISSVNSFVQEIHSAINFTSRADGPGGQRSSGTGDKLIITVERQNVTNAGTLVLDRDDDGNTNVSIQNSTSLPINSYMVYLNDNHQKGDLTNKIAQIVFSNEIYGIYFDASDTIFKANISKPGATYPTSSSAGVGGRAFETYQFYANNSTSTHNKKDWVSVGSDKKTLRVGTKSGKPGDYIRVITAATPQITVDFNASSSSGAESISTANLQVDLSQSSSSAITVDYTVTGSASGSGTDYVLSNGTLTIPANTTSKNISIASIIDDALDEPNETVIVTLSNSVGAILGTDNVHTYTINDNDAQPSISINDITIVEETANATFTVTLSAASGRDVRANYSTGSVSAIGSGAGGTDFTGISGIVTFFAGETTKEIDVPVLEDALTEPNETATLNLTSPIFATISDATGVLTITDDDNTLVGFNVTSSSHAEWISTANLTVDLSAVSTNDVTVSYTVTGGTATGSGTDYTLANGTLTIPAGSATGTITITGIVEDSIDEANETVIVTLSGPTNATLGTATVHTYTIYDNDPTPPWSIDDVTILEETANATFTVTLSAASEQELNFDYFTGSDSAIGSGAGGTDFTEISGTLTFAAGETTKEIDVPVLEDTIDEANETATLTIESGYFRDQPSIGILTITDDDAPPSLSINDVTIEEETANATFTVTLSAASEKEVNVNYTTGSDSAIGSGAGGTDFTGISGTLTFAAGDTTKEIDVPVLEDALTEPNETATLNLTSPIFATISDATGVLTITDDDEPPLVDFNVTSSSGSESLATANLTVDLSAVSANDVAVSYTVTGTATGSGTDYTLATGTLTIPAGSATGTITITGIVDDSLIEDDETVVVTLSANPTNATLGTDTAHTYTINDNEELPGLTINDVTITESAANAAFTVSISKVSEQDVTFSWATQSSQVISAKGTDLSGTDYTSASSTGTITAGNLTTTVNVGILEDTIDEHNETALLSIYNVSNAYTSLWSPPTGVFIIVDDDNPPSLSINDVTIVEETANATFTVTLSAASEKEVSVNYTTGSDSAIGSGAGGTDFTGISGTLTFAAGDTTKEVNVPVLEDTIDEANETATINLTSPIFATISDATGVLTITDDDEPPLVDFNVTSSSGSESLATANLTVDLSAVSANDVTVSYTVTGGTATGSGTDYTLANGTLTITAGSTSGYIQIANIVDDTLDEANETVVVTLSANPTNATLGTDDDHTYTINDNDASPSLSIDDLTITEADTSDTFTVTLSAVSGQQVTVDYALSDVTTTSGTDYTAVSSGTLTFIAGQTSKTITVPILEDALDEANETLTLTLSGAVNATISDSTGTLTITDDDDPISLSIDDVTFTESAANATFTVTLSAVSGRDVTVNYASSDGTATSGPDYAASSGTITISAGATTGTFNVPVLEDTIDEANETVTLTLSGAGNATISDATGTLTITDDDDPLSVDFNVTSSSGSESSSSANLIVDLSVVPTSDVTVSYTVTGTATGSGTDYTLANGTLTIPAGSATGIITITPIVDDSVIEDDETVIVTLSSPSSNATLGTDTVHTYTINDNEALPDLTIDDVSFTEANANAIFTVTSSAVSEQDVTFHYRTHCLTTCGGFSWDYGGISNPIQGTILAGQTSTTLTVTVNQDSIDEYNETAKVVIFAAENATIPDVSEEYFEKADGAYSGITVTGELIGILTIIDNDDPPTISINNQTLTESASNATFTLTLSKVSEKNITVNYASSNGTAISGDDYTTSSGTLTVGLGNSYTTYQGNSSSGKPVDLSATFTVPVLEDTIDEPNETATLTLSGAINATTPDPTGTLTITDDDNPPLVDFNIASSSGDESISSAILTVDLSAVSTSDVTVDYASTGGTAVYLNCFYCNLDLSADYTYLSGTLTIPAGATTGVITIPSIINDSREELDETVIVTLSSPSSNATLGTATVHTYTILDNDDPATLSIDDVTINEDSGGGAYAMFTVSRSEGSETGWQTVDYALSDVTTTSTDYGQYSAVTLPSGTLTFMDGVTSVPIKLLVIEDDSYEFNETATMTLSNPTGGLTISDPTGTLTIIDNDDPLELSIGDVTFTESAANATFTVTLSAVSGRDVTVNYASSDGTATSGPDYAASSGTITISAGDTTGTFNVPVLEDTIDEPNETVTLTLSGAINATISDATGVLTITDDDNPPLVDFNITSSSGDESISSAILTVDLSSVSSADATVNYTVAGTATGAGETDYTLANGNLTIPAGSTTGTITITSIVDDLIDEADETVIVTLSGPTNATLGTDTTHTYTIIDNDEAVVNLPELSINDVTFTESAADATFTVTLSETYSQAVTVQYVTSDETATVGSDYTSSSGTITIPVGATTGTFTVPVLEDTIDEANETVYLSLFNATNATILDETGTLTITDDDEPPLVDFNLASSSGSESLASANLTVDLSVVSTNNVTVSYTVTGGTATGSGTDYTLANATLMIPAGSTTGTITITPIVDDSIDEDDETVIVTLSGPTNATLGTDTAHTYTINDNEALPELTIGDVTITESAANATFTVTLSAASGRDVTVNYASSDGTATTAGPDYTAASGTITISAGVTTGTFNVPVLEDTIDEANETLTLTLSGAINATISDSTGTLTITDDDDPISLSIDDVTITESAANATFTVTLSAVSGRDVTVNYATSDGTATAAGPDYTAVSGTITISAGTTTGTFNVPVLEDTIDEANETLTLTLSGAGNATISDATGTLTITDDDNPPLVDFNITSSSASESVSSTVLTVDLSTVSTLGVTVSYTVTGTATGSGTDYTLADATLTIPAGSATGTITIAGIVDDLIIEADETVIVTLSVPTNATLGTDTAHTYTINDNEALPELTIGDVTITESAANATFTVTLSAVSGKDVTVNYASSDGTATTADDDYTATSGTVTISAGDTTGTFTVPVLEDTIDEANETLTLTLSGAVNATISDSTGTLTITDDDDPISLSIDDVTFTESAANATFTVTLSAVSGRDVTVNYASSDGTATSGPDYAASSGTITISAGDTTGTFNVPVLEDTIDEPNETLTLTLSGAINATISDATGTLTITDDDDPLSVDFNVTSSSGSESSSSANLIVDLSVVSTSDVTVSYTVTGTATGSGTDYTLADATLTIPAGSATGIITITGIVDDLIDEADETVIVTLSSPSSNATLGTDTVHTYTINDNEALPELTINDQTITESAANATFTVTLSAVSGRDVTVNYASSDGTATTAGPDYAASSGTITISAGTTTGTFNVPVLEDTIDEANETLTLTLSGAINATISDATGTLTITDDDDPISLSINDVTFTESAANATFTVTLSAVSGKDVTVNYASSNGTAMSGDDYTTSSGTLTISAGATTGTFNVPVLEDTIDEPNETVTLTLSGAGNATISDATGTLTITDDDNPPLVDFNITSSSASESVSSTVLTVDLSTVSTLGVTVSYTVTGTATGSGTDYTLANATLTIPAGSTTGTITITPIVDDLIDEADETVIVTLSGPTNATLGTDTVHTYTINDNDLAPTLEIPEASINTTTDDESTADVTFTVTLSTASGQDITVDYATSDGTATAGEDYTSTTGTLTILAGQTSTTFKVGVVDDTVDEDNEVVNITLSNAVNATISDATGTLTITDDDDPISLSIDDVTFTESAANATFTVTLSAVSGKDVTVNYASSNGTAMSGDDYTTSSGTLTISAGATTGTFNVPVLEDTIDEPNETLTLTLSGAGNATISDATGTLTITDDDNPPLVDFNITSSSASESVSSTVLTVDLSTVSTLGVTVSYTVTGTATGSGTDYTLANATLTIPAGSTTGTITITPIVDDLIDEADETVIVTLSGPTNATLGTDTVHTYTINDNDLAPTLEIPEASINTTTDDESTADVTFTVTLSTASGQDITVDYATSDGTATAGEDYTSTTGTLTILAGQTSTTFKVGVVDDTVDEDNEVVNITLSNAVNATISDSTGTLTITDDDDPISLSIDDVTFTESAANATFTVTLSAVSGKDVTVNYASSNGTAMSGDDYTTSSGTLTISAGATTGTFNVPVLEDTIDEPNETLTLTLSGAGNATISDATGTLTITDDDSAPMVGFRLATSDGSESQSTAAIHVDLSASSSREVTVNYSVTGGTATGSGVDYTLNSGILTFSAGDTSEFISIPSVMDDSIDESNETIVLSLSNSTNATISSPINASIVNYHSNSYMLPSHTYTINDNDDNTNPTLVSMSPYDEELNVSIGSNIVLTFSEDIVGVTGNITLYKPGPTIVEVFDITSDVTITGNTITINPAVDLLYSIGYWIEIDNTAVDDLFSNSYAPITALDDALEVSNSFGDPLPASLNFSTEEDLTRPVVTITSEEVYDGDATGDSSLSIIFTLSEEASDFDVTDIDVTNGTLTGFSGSGTSFTATFTPTSEGLTSINITEEQFSDLSFKDNLASKVFKDGEEGEKITKPFNWTYYTSFSDPTSEKEVVAFVEAWSDIATRWGNINVNAIHDRLTWLERNKHNGMTSHQGIKIKFADERLDKIMNTPSGNAEFDLNSIRNNVVASLGGNENCFGNDNELIDQPLNGNAACDNGSYKETQDVLSSLESEIQSVALNEAKKIRESAIGTLNPVFKPIVNDWSMWTSGTLTAGKNIETSTASKQQIISQSLHLGFDRPTDRPTDDRDGVVGFALGIGYDKTDVGEDISNVKSTNYSLSAYGEIYPQEDNTLEGVVGLGHLKFRTARLDKDGLDTLTGKRDANQLFGSLKWKGKYDGTVKYEGTANEDEWTVHPYGKIEASRTKFDKFSESGSVNALTFENQYLTNVRGSIGVDAHYLHKIDDKTVSPFLNLEYGEKLFNSSAPVLYASQADNKVEPTIYSITIDNTSKDDIRFGLGVGINTDDDFNAVVGYKRTQQIEDDLGLGKNYTDQVYLELEWEFASCYGWLYKDTACFIEPHATTDSTPNVFDVGGKAVTFDNQSYGHIELLLDRGIANILSNAATQK